MHNARRDILSFRLCCKRLKLETSCGCFLCKNTCLNSSKAKGKSRLSTLVTALDKNSAETIPKTSSEAKQCTCAGMTPAASALRPPVVCDRLDHDTEHTWTKIKYVSHIPVKVSLFCLSVRFQMHLILQNTGVVSVAWLKMQKNNETQKQKPLTVLWRQQKPGLFK